MNSLPSFACSSNVLERFVEMIRSFLIDIEYDKPALEKKIPVHYKELIFTKETLIQLEDLEKMVEGYLLDLCSLNYVTNFKKPLQSYLLRSRVYEYALELGKQCESCLTENNLFMESIVSNWRQLINLEKLDPDLINPLYKDFSKRAALWEMLNRDSVITLKKCSQMMYKTCKYLRIPSKVNDGFPLRSSMAFVYYLIQDRISVLDRFSQLIQKFRELHQFKCVAKKEEEEPIVFQPEGDPHQLSSYRD